MSFADKRLKIQCGLIEDFSVPFLTSEESCLNQGKSRLNYHLSIISVYDSGHIQTGGHSSPECPSCPAKPLNFVNKSIKSGVI